MVTKASSVTEEDATTRIEIYRDEAATATQGLLCSSFWLVYESLVQDYRYATPKTKLGSSLQVM